MLWARRAGKDIFSINIALLQALQERCTIVYLFSTQRHARDVIWSSVTFDGKPFLSYIPEFLIAKKNDTRLEITLRNGSIIALRGSNRPETLKGLNAKLWILSEYADHDPICWQQVIQPILRANQGIAMFVSTPNGMNHYYQLCELAQNDDRWLFDKKTIEDTGHISVQEVEEDIKRGLISRELAEQEYYCSFLRGQRGIVFGNELYRMRLDERITSVPYEDGHLTYLAADLGWDDDTALVWFQVIGQTVRIIDYYANRQKDLAHYAQIIHSKPYTMGGCFFPHDTRQHNVQTGTTRLDTLYDLGIKVEVIKVKAVIDRIEDGKQLFAKAWIDERKCEGLIQSLDNYHREWNETMGRYNEMPVHDKWSHAADAWTYMAIAIKDGYVHHSGLTQSDINDLKRKAKAIHDPFDIVPYRNPNMF